MATDPPAPIDWSSLPEETVTPGVTRQVVHGAHQTLVRYRYLPGSVFPVHAHAQEQITVVLSGRIRFDIAGSAADVGPGEVIVIPGNVPHGAITIGDQPVETLNVLSPRRETSPAIAGNGR